MSGVTTPPPGLGGVPVDPLYKPPSHSDQVKQGNNAVSGTDQSQTQSPDKADQSGEGVDTGSSDTTFRNVTDEDGQGGGTGSGDGDNSGEGGRKDGRDEAKFALGDDFGISNIIDGVTLNSAVGVQKGEISADVMSKAFQAVFSQYTAPVATGSPGAPNLFKPGGFDAKAVLDELQGNPWFNSTFLTAITVNMSTLVAIQSKIQEAEMKLSVLMMEQTVTQAHLTGDLIVAAAEKEAQMYMAMAIASMVSLAVGLVGAGMSGVGKYKSAMKSVKLKELKQGNKLDAQPDQMKGDLSGGSVETKSIKKADKLDSTKKNDKLDENDNQKAADRDNAAVEGADAASAKKVRFADERKNANDQKVEAENNSVTDMTKDAASARAKDRRAINKQEQKAQVEAEETKPTKANDDAKAQKDNFDEIKANMKSKARWEAMGDAGTFFVQTNNSLNSILTNFIQMVFKPEIAEIERGRTLSEARQKIIAAALDYATQAANTAAQIIDAALQELQKIQDENSRANDMKG